jgi:hypothetical protein
MIYRIIYTLFYYFHFIFRISKLGATENTVGQYSFGFTVIHYNITKWFPFFMHNKFILLHFYWL